MKNNLPSPEQVVAWIAKIQENPNQSIAIVRDNNNKPYSVKSVTEVVALSLKRLENGNMLKGSFDPVTGVRGTKGLQYDKSKILGVTSIGGLFDGSQALETDEAVALLPWATAPTPAVKNSIVKLMQNGEIFRSIGSDVFAWRASTSSDDDFREILPVTIMGGVDFNINITLPDSAVVAAGAAAMIRLRGFEFTAI